MTLADVLTDEMIGTVANAVYHRLIDRVERSESTLCIAQIATVAETCVRDVLKEQRQQTYRFTVDVRAADAQAAGFRLLRLLNPNPAVMFPDDITVDPGLSPDGVRQRWPEPDEPAFRIHDFPEWREAMER